MKRAYLASRADLAEFGTIDARHFCSLAGLKCQKCGFWSGAGLEYPTISVSALGERVQQRLFYGPPDVARPLRLEELERFRAELDSTLGPDRPLAPGASFGPLVGRASGRMGDFAWVGLWTALVRASVFTDLLDAGFDLLGVPADLDFAFGEFEALVELEACPTARLPASMRPEQCVVCGRTGGFKVKRPVIEMESFDEAIPIQRILDWPTYLVVNGTFADYVRQQNLRDITLTPLELV